MRVLGHTLGLLALLAGVGCSPTEDSLRTPETFQWCEQPVAFSPLADPWVQERHQPGGQRGVSFTRYESPLPSRISIAEYVPLGNRDRRPHLRALLETVENIDELIAREFLDKVDKAQPKRFDPLDDSETRIAEQTNAALDRAVRS